MTSTRGQAPLPSQEVWISMYWDAHYTSMNMRKSWEAEGDHNITIEGIALRHAVRLDALCEGALVPGDPYGVVPVASSVAGPETRYRLEAAIRTVHGAVPFAWYRRVLRTDLEIEGAEWAKRMEQREPRILAQWHSWLWSSHRAEELPRAETDHRDGDHGESTVLEIAAADLASQISTILE